ncbi:hypothetical protein QR685DRAFT_530904 [Neurospora intermedia]|uniref:Uncharacterized protein n=1 Tax=Neurospora intermedia TaxID=5142 RepID=A0ABR3D831_NEUIN
MLSSVASHCFYLKSSCDITDVWWIQSDHSLWPPRTVVGPPHPLLVTPPSRVSI